MTDTPSVDATVSVDTDDLDDFNKLLNGEAGTADANKEGEDQPDVNPVEDTDAAEDDDSNEDATPDEDGEDEDETPPEPKKKPTAKERINELTAARREAERRAAALEERLAKLEAAAPKQTVQKPVEDKAPDPDAKSEDGSLVYPLGEFDPKYIADLTRHTIKVENEKIASERDKTEAQRKQEAEAAELQNTWNQKLDKAGEGIEDLRETIQTLEEEFSHLDESYGVYLAQTIMKMDHGPEVLYYLANNVAETRKIVTMGSVDATIALAKIEAKIEAALDEKVTPPVRKTKAPTPPVPTKGNSGRTGVSGDTDDLDAFEKAFFKKR